MDALPPLSAAALAVVPGIYEHYARPGESRVIGVARQSETLEELVVYEHLDDRTQWVSPLAMFTEVVDGPSGPRPRFRWLRAE